MKYFVLFILLSLITISSAFPSGNNKIERRNQCSCSFVTADFDSDGVKGVVAFAQDESGHTEVTGIFSKGLSDTSAKYGFKIVNECREELFDLSDALNIQADGSGGSHSFRHKFTDLNIDCDSNGILRKVIHNSKRNGNCSNNKLKKRTPNGGEFTQNGGGSSYAGLS
jgi:hypothetical protein